MNRQQSLLGFEPWAPIEEVVVTPSRHGDVEAESATLARDILGFDSFTGYIDSVEVIIL